MLGMKLLVVLACTIFLARAAGKVQSPVVVLCKEGHGNYTVPLGSSLPPTIVRSSNYGKGNYGNNEQCVVEFVAKVSLILKLTFKHFNLESERRCQRDFLCVHGVDYCHETLANSTLAYNVPAGQTFTLLFRADHSITRTGFDILVEAVLDKSSSKKTYHDGCKAKIIPQRIDDYDYTHYDYIEYTGQPTSDSKPYETTDSYHYDDYGYNGNNY